ncbi:helix-turn-helix domain-containing protein [Streptomyces coeruleorubidus]|uniref:Helix-turn-helix transcriptional regulator n=1 Tax=Streptomyces coeruleorubidus TaxID=116188 RepID=A0ABZ0KBI7_STRC4|nr:helix-turn-helix transcriptional regulator [Streptomyces coeruleorubidus]WOT35089.1 helix-turn-helix transcriptional regulator [Streptomyces coeruleorubidus]
MSRRNGGAESGASTAAVFGEVLRHFREAALLTQEGLARQIPCDRSHVARVEAGTRVPQEGFAKKCDELLGTGGVLLRLWGRIDWYPQVEHPDWFRRRAEMDEVAVALREYQERVIPGLLQTPEYARALFRRVASGDDVEERAHARLSRQRRFLAEGGPLYIAVLDESCLRNVVGSPETMRDQCAHLLHVGRRPNIRLQVAPASFSELLRPNVSMSLIELPDGHRWVYSESLERGHFSDDPTVYTRHSHTYDVLRADALSVRESVALISDAMKGYEQHEHARTLRGDLDQEQLQRRKRRQLRGNSPRFPRHRPRPRQQNL